MKVENVPLEDLMPYANNPRKNDHAVDDMVKVIEAVGFRVPLLVKGNEIVDGHLRAKAAKKMGLTEVPVVRCDDMDDKSVRLLRLMVNKAAEFADWDFDLLAGEFEDLEDAGVDFGEYDFEWFPKKRAARKSAAPRELLEVEEYNECPRCGHTWG
jgi:ParB-like chromosome segregation protein Spo0J